MCKLHVNRLYTACKPHVNGSGPAPCSVRGAETAPGSVAGAGSVSRESRCRGAVERLGGAGASGCLGRCGMRMHRCRQRVCGREAVAGVGPVVLRGESIKPREKGKHRGSNPGVA